MALVLVCTAISLPLNAADATAAKPAPIPIANLNRSTPVDFAREVLPILRQNCLACHNGTEAESELVLETPESIRKGGESGAAVVPGQGGASRLLQAAAHQEDLVMPPVDNKVGAVALSSEQLGLVKLWIDQGALGETLAPRVIVRRPLPPTVRPILATAITPDDELVACNRGDQLFVYDLRGMRVAAELVDPALAAAGRTSRAHDDLIRSLAFDRSGTLLASGGFRGVKLWRRPVTKLQRELATASPARVQVISADSQWIALGTEAGTIELADAEGKQPVKTLAGHQAAITGLIFTPDGKRLYSSSLDKTVRAWDLAAGTALGKFTVATEVRGLALCAAGTQIATADADQTIRLWPIDVVRDPPLAEPAMPLRELKGHAQPIVALTVAPTPSDPAAPSSATAPSERLVSASQDGRLKIWNPADGALLRELDHGGPAQQIAVRPDGQRIASVGTNGVARLWNPADGALVVEIKADPRAARAMLRADAAVNYARACVEYRKEEHRESEEQVKREMTALEGGQKNKVDAEKAATDKIEPAKKAAEASDAAEKAFVEATAALKDVNDKRTVAKAAVDAAELVVVQARKTAEAARDVAAKDKDNAALAAARDAADKLLAEATAKKQAADTAYNETAPPIGPAQQKLQQAANARGDAARKAKDTQRELDDARAVVEGITSYIATATIVVERAKAAVPVVQQTIVAAEATLAAREAEKKSLDPIPPQKPLHAVAFSADGAVLAVAGEAGAVLLLDGERGTPLEVVDGHRASIGALNFLSGRLLSSDAERRTIVWKTGGPWTLERTVGGPDEPGQPVDRVLGLDFSPDGTLMATAGGLAGRAGELKIWSVADGKLVREIASGARDTIYSAKFSPDGQWLATTSADRQVRVFRTADGTLAQTLAGHTHHVLGASWRPDGKLLATCSGDHTIKVWNLETGTAVQTMRGDTYQIGEYKREVTSISFIGNTEHLLASGGDHTVRQHRTSSTRDVRTFKDSPAFMHSAVATSDGKLVIAGGQDGVLRVWNGETGYSVQVFAPSGTATALAP